MSTNTRSAFSSEETEAILNDHRLGMNLGQLERKYVGRTRSTLRRLLIRNGREMHTRQYRHKLAEAEQQALIHDYQEGLTMEECSRKYGLSVGAIQCLFGRNKVQARPRGKASVVFKGGQKKCPRCDQMKDLTEFQQNTSMLSGYNSYCKECDRWRTRSSRYSLTREQYQALLAAQGNRCPICERSVSEVTTPRHPDLVVDHDHQTGAVRGLICSSCNKGLGLFRDDQRLLQRAIAYLGRQAAGA